MCCCWNFSYCEKMLKATILCYSTGSCQQPRICRRESLFFRWNINVLIRIKRRVGRWAFHSVLHNCIFVCKVRTTPTCKIIYCFATLCLHKVLIFKASSMVPYIYSICEFKKWNRTFRLMDLRQTTLNSNRKLSQFDNQ